MSIIEQIKEIANDEEHRSRIGLCEYGPDVDDLIALAESHERLLKAVERVLEREDIKEGAAGSTASAVRWSQLYDRAKEAEKI